MKLEEAIVVVLASANSGLRTEQIARLINERKFCTLWDGRPVDGRAVYAAAMANPGTFSKSEGRIWLII